MLLGALANEGGEVTAGAVLHDDVDAPVLAVDDAVVVADDVAVVKLAEDVDLGHELRLLLLGHGAVRQLLPHEEGAVGQARMRDTWPKVPEPMGQRTA